MEHASLLVTLVLALGVAVVGAAVAARLGQSVILGYILAGIVIDPYASGGLGRSATIEEMADIGIILLLFALGVRLSFRDLLRVGPVALLGGTVQVLALLGLGAGAGLALGWPPTEALFFGAVIAISSSAALGTLLQERGEEGTEHGRIALAWSAVQDLGTIILVVVLSALAGHGTSPVMGVLGGAGKAVLFLTLVVPFGVWVLPWLFERVAALHNRELFVLLVASVALGMAYASSLFGLSLALGAFVAGIVVGESDLAHQILGAILPLRDIFAALFFVSVGMLVSPLFVLDHLALVLLTLALIMLAKGMLAALLTLLFRYAVRTALLTGALLAQAGEFSFILATLGSSLRAVTPTVFSLLLAGTALSIVLSPTVYRAARPIAAWLERHQPGSALPLHPGLADGTAHRLHGHAVVGGHGRVGAAIVTALRQCQIPLVIIERDHRVVRQLRAQGMHALLGDAANPVLLEHARLEEADVLVLAIPDVLTVRQVVAYAHRSNPGLEIVARTHSAAEEAYLSRQGVGDVVLGELELALGMARYTLRRFGVGEGETEIILQDLRGQDRTALASSAAPSPAPSMRH